MNFAGRSSMFRFSIRQLEVFLSVCETGSFRRAADSMDISEAGVSSHMRLLEGQLGCELFIRRSGSAISLSSAGAEFQEGITEFVAQGRALSRKWDAGDEQAVKLRVYVGEHLMEDFVRPALSTFLCSHPHIQLDFKRFESRNDVHHAMKQGELDCVLMNVKDEAELPSSKLLSPVPAGVYVARELKERAEQEGLAEIRYLVSQRDVSCGRVGNDMMRSGGIDKSHIAGRYPYHDVGISMAMQGLGAIVTIASAVQAVDKDGVLVMIKELEPWQRRLFLSEAVPKNAAHEIERFFTQVLEAGPATRELKSH